MSAPTSCEMDYSHCDGIACTHGAPIDYHDCGIPVCLTGELCDPAAEPVALPVLPRRASTEPPW